MDVLDFINRNGQRTVPNPNYNPRSKKNTEPPTIIVPEAQPIPDDVKKKAKRDAFNQFSLFFEYPFEFSKKVPLKIKCNEQKEIGCQKQKNYLMKNKKKEIINLNKEKIKF